MSITPEESRRRAEDVARIAHSTEMEGGRIPPEAMVDLSEYVAGRIDEDEMIRRGRARFGLDEGASDGPR